MSDWTQQWSAERLNAVTDGRRFVGRGIALGFTLWGIGSGPVPFALTGDGLAAAILSGVCAAAWLLWSAGLLPASQRIGERAVIAAVALYGLGGAVLTGLHMPTVAVVFPALASFSGGIRFPALSALAGGTRFPALWALLAPTAFSAAMLVTATLSHANLGTGVGYVGLLYGLYALGIARRAQILRAETAEQLVTETQRANSEQAHAAALAERSRIAREIHDVLAHSLSALTVQLEAADALLTTGTDPAKAHGYVVKARRIAREGLTETRRAIAALREDTPPLRTLLTELAESYEADTGASATVIAEREPIGLAPDASLALYRTAQESLTNARKHAPNAPIEIALSCGESTIELTVTNLAATGPITALHASGGGYGLAGLKERAELAGGTLDAGPHGEGWRVRLAIPRNAAAEVAP
ncbi:MAG: sensor histidine kinase [Actinocrinis sp.]